MFDTKNFHPFTIDSTELLKTLHSLGNFSYIINPGNMGDMLIASATMQFFDNNNLTNNIDNYSSETIVYGGGGLWTSDYEKRWIKFLPVFARAKRIVILPSSFNKCQKLINIMDERFVVFCREYKSYDYLISTNSKAKIILDHDMALRIQKEILSFAPQINDLERNILNQVIDEMKKVSLIAKFMRKDLEKIKNYETDFDLSSSGFCDHDTNRDYIDFNSQLMLCAVDSVDAIITDRLHVAIAGALMGKEVYILDNSYGKLSSVYKHSLSDNPRVHFCTKMPSTLNPKHTATDNFDRLKELLK